MTPFFSPLLALLALSHTVSATRPPILCDVEDFVLDTRGHSELNIPSGAKPHYVAWGSGTQNYTCSNGAYKYQGELAELFDVSCLIHSKNFGIMRKRDNALYGGQDVWEHEASIRRMLGPDAQAMGKVYSQRNNNDTYPSTYEFDKYQYNGDSNQYVSTYWVANVSAPGETDGDWWKLGAASGSLADYVYRIDTHGGKPPASCMPGYETIAIRYSAKYVFYKGPSTSNGAGGVGGAINAALSSDNLDASTVQKLLDYAPAILGLLVATTLLSLTLVVMGILSIYRRRRGSVPMRSAAYRPIQLPRTKTPMEGSYRDDPEPYGA